jgi:sugar phosphate isomerase/epimerase
MIVGAAKLIRHDTSEKDFELFSGLNTQLTFFPRGFYDVDHSNLKKIIDNMNVNPVSIHYPSFPGNDSNFVDNLKMLRDEYCLDLFVMHPKFEDYTSAMVYLRSKSEEISKLGVKLAYENMPGPKNSWVCDIFSLCFGFPFTSLTYDVTHLAERMNEVAEIDGLLNRTDVVHLSNVNYGENKRHDHLRINEGSRDLVEFCKYLKGEEYSGQVILEYLPRKACFLKEDVKLVEDLVL